METKNKPQRPSRLVDQQAIKPEKEFERTYKEAYKFVDEGITKVTEGKNREALDLFNEGLLLLDKALSTKVERFDVDAEQIQLYEEMRIKMRCTKKEVMNHFSDLHLGSGASARATAPVEDQPPSYDEYLSSLSSNENQSSSFNLYPHLDPSDPTVQAETFDEILNAPMSTISSPGALSPQNGELIFNIENGVQIFFIYSDGRVTTPSVPSFLAIFTFKDPIFANASQDNPGARGFIQVGEWSYPLVTARSPVLHAFYGAYMFPDPANPIPGTSVGILIPDYINKSDRELFEQILHQLTCFQLQLLPDDQEEAKIALERKESVECASERIAKGALSVSKGVVWGAEKLSGLIAYSSDKLKQSIEPEAQARQVDPKWQTTAKVARDVSSGAVKVSGFLLNQVGKATMALGRKVAPTLHKHGTKYYGQMTGQAVKDSKGQVDGAMEVASGVVKGGSIIYMSLEDAAAMLATSLSDNTVKVVAHKYGPEVGTVTDDGLKAVGQGIWAGHNITSLGVKGIAKKAARDTGKALVADHQEKKVKKKKNGENGELFEDEVMDGVEEGVEAKVLDEKKDKL